MRISGRQKEFFREMPLLLSLFFLSAKSWLLPTLLAVPHLPQYSRFPSFGISLGLKIVLDPDTFEFGNVGWSPF